MQQDWIGAIRAAYSLEGDLGEWLRGVLERTGPLLDRGSGVIAYAYARRSDLPGLALQTVWRADPEVAAANWSVMAAFTGPAVVRRLTAAGLTYASLSEFLFRESPELAEEFRARTGFRDSVGLVVETATGYGLSISALTRDICTTEPRERRRWSRVAAHLAAGLRLRLALEAGGADAGTVEAVLDPDARVVEMTERASDSRARRVLREAVMRRERADLAAQQSGPDSALGLWEGLVGGRWSLVDRFASDGGRFIVAHRNDPEVGPPRGLTRRERQVAEYVGMGRSSKEIAYLLGIRASAVSNAIMGSIRKLGLRGRAELASFFAEGEVRARLIEMDVAGEPLVATVAPGYSATLVADLSGTEREIAHDLVQGWTAPAIADRRNTSVRTIETQVRSIYAKLGVRSRVELCVRLARP